jgi:hypothetical protein
VTLPKVGDYVEPSSLIPPGNASKDGLRSHPPVTQDNADFNPKSGIAAWVGNHFVISGAGAALVNYYFVPAAKPGKVSYCVVPCDSYRDAYVASDQFGGCEYHELYNEQFKELTFLHVYRSGGTAAKYTAGEGWKFNKAKYSNRISKAAGMKVSNWSVSHIDRSTNPPKVLSKFIHLEHLPTLDSLWSRRQWRRVDRGGDRPCAAHRKAPAKGRRGLR